MASIGEELTPSVTSGIPEPVGALKHYPDKRRPLVTLYGVKVADRPAYLVKWKCPRSGKWLTKRRRSRKSAEAIALRVLSEIRSGDSTPGLLTSSDRERLDLAKGIPMDRLRAIAAEYRSLKQRITFSEWLERYEMISEVLSKLSRREIKTRSRGLDEAFGAEYLDTLSPDRVEGWYRKRLGQVATRTANNELALLKRVMNRARERGYLPTGPTAADKVVKVKEVRPNVEIFDIATTRVLLANLPEVEKAATFVLIGLFAGLRPSELEGVDGGRQGLDWRDIDFEAGYIHVRAEVAGKKTGERYVDLSPNLVEMLMPYRKRSGPVCRKKSRRLASLHYRALKVIEEWPADVTRHSYCSYLLAKTQDIGYVADQAGNSPGTIKKNYRRPLPKEAGEEFFGLLIPPAEGENIVAIA